MGSELRVSPKRELLGVVRQVRRGVAGPDGAQLEVLDAEDGIGAPGLRGGNAVFCEVNGLEHVVGDETEVQQGGDSDAARGLQVLHGPIVGVLVQLGEELLEQQRGAVAARRELEA